MDSQVTRDKTGAIAPRKAGKMRPLLIVGGGGLLLWYLNSKGYLNFGTTTAPATTGPATGSGTGAGTGTGSGGGTSAPNYNSLAAIYTRLVADAGATAQTNGLTADGWNYSLARVVANVTPPDPAVLFPDQDRAMKITAATYWSAVSPYLHTTYNLSGLRGLGMARYGGWAA